MFMFYSTCICKGAGTSCIKHISPNVILSGESNSTKNLEILILFPLGYQQLCIQTTVSLNRREDMEYIQLGIVADFGTQRSPQGAECIHDVFATWMLVFAIKVGTKCLNTSNHQAVVDKFLIEFKKETLQNWTCELFKFLQQNLLLTQGFFWNARQSCIFALRGSWLHTQISQLKSKELFFFLHRRQRRHTHQTTQEVSVWMSETYFSMSAHCWQCHNSTCTSRSSYKIFFIHHSQEKKMTVTLMCTNIWLSWSFGSGDSYTFCVCEGRNTNIL